MVLVFLRDWRSVIVVVLNIPFALAGALVAPLADRPDDQPHDPRRPGAGHRHPRGRVDGRDREHPRQDGAHRLGRPAPSGRATWTRPSPGCWRCSASSRCSSRRSSCRGRPRRCSCRSRWPSASRWSPRTCSPARSCRSSPPGCSAATIARANGHRAADALRPAPRPLRPGPRAGRPRSAGWSCRPTWRSPRLVIFGVGRGLGLEIFPQVDAGRFQLRVKAPAGTRIEKTEQIAQEALETIDEEVGRGRRRDLRRLRRPDPVELPDQRHLPVDRRPGGGVAPGGHEARRRASTSRRSKRRLRERARRAEMPDVQVLVRAGRHRQRRDELRLADARRGRRQRPQLRREPRPTRRRSARSWRRIPSLRDLQYGQALDYPTVERRDRPRAGRPQRRDGRGGRPLAGHRHLVQPVRRAQLLARPEDRHRLPGAGRDPLPGHELGRSRSRPSRSSAAAARRCCSATWPTSAAGTMPGEYDRYNMKRSLSLTANIVGRGPGPGLRAGSPRPWSGPASRPRGCMVDVRGQIAPMREILRGLSIGLAMSVVVIVLLLTANFQSVRLALVAVATAPAVIAGVAVALLAHRDDDQPPVVHGGDHGHRRRGGQRDPAGDLRRAEPPGRRPRPARPPSAAPATACGRS